MSLYLWGSPKTSILNQTHELWNVELQKLQPNSEVVGPPPPPANRYGYITLSITQEPLTILVCFLKISYVLKLPDKHNISKNSNML